jgi:hypothetical protein
VGGIKKAKSIETWLARFYASLAPIPVFIKAFKVQEFALVVDIPAMSSGTRQT